MNRGAALFVSGCAVVACSPAYAPSVAPGGMPVEPAAPVVSVGNLSDLRASLDALGHLAYDWQSLGVAAAFIKIRLTNPGPRDVPVGQLHATFAATRNGVAFPCNSHVGAAAGTPEPSHLEPGRSFTFERLLDCSMPLPGRYEVSVWAHTADREPTEPSAGVFVGTVAIDVTASANAPRLVSLGGEVYAVMSGAPMSVPMGADAWAGGHYQVAVALVNGSDRTVTVGPSSLSLLVSREGELLPCTEGRILLHEPDALAPGTVHVVRVPVTCEPTRQGRYLVVGRFTDREVHDVEIGRFGLLVTGNPYFSFAAEWPGFVDFPREHPP